MRHYCIQVSNVPTAASLCKGCPLRPVSKGRALKGTHADSPDRPRNGTGQRRVKCPRITCTLIPFLYFVEPSLFNLTTCLPHSFQKLLASLLPYDRGGGRAGGAGGGVLLSCVGTGRGGGGAHSLPWYVVRSIVRAAENLAIQNLRGSLTYHLRRTDITAHCVCAGDTWSAVIRT